MARWAGVLAIAVGAFVLGFDVSRWDGTVVTLSSGHGIHASNLAGVVLVTAGTFALWLAAAPAHRVRKR